MNIKGKLIEIFEVQTIKDTFRKREFVVEFAENPQYPELIKLELTQDKCGLLDSIALGTEVEVFFNLRGRAWTNNQGVKQYFNTLQAWKINATQNAASAPAVTTVNNTSNQGADDDMPF